MIEGKESVLTRVWNLLTPDRIEIRNIYIFAIFSGIISLGLPLGIQMIINFIQLGQLSASWFLLVGLVVAAIGFSGVMNILQLRITENLQQRIFTRSAFEFAYRIPKIKLEALRDFYHPEINARFFDTLTIQKAISKLLIDFMAASLQILFGLGLLAFYHSFFIFFGVGLLFLLYIIIRLTSKGGYKTSLKESSQKYKVVNWLNEINIARSSVRNAGTNFHLTVVDEKLQGYINARKTHFRILVQQYGYLILFKILIALCLLIVGGLLVVNQEMNIGQFVASEIIIVLVLSSVEKIILNLDLVYDVLTSIEKIGQVTDLPIEERKGSQLFVHSEKGVHVEVKGLSFRMEETNISALNHFSFIAMPGQKISIVSDSSLSSKSFFLILLGHLNKYSGSIFLDNQPLDNLDQNEMLKSTGAVLAEDKLIFGSIKENILFGRTDFQLVDIIEICRQLDIDKSIEQLKDKYETLINPDYLVIPYDVERKILLARVMLTKPKLMLLENLSSGMNNKQLESLLTTINSIQDCTLLIASQNPKIHRISDVIIEIENGQIVFNGSYESYSKK
jgi:ABC-type bacteriocin/lantibiotic exporter with double-glycine peptidase domain